MNNAEIWQWGIMIGISVILFIFAPFSKTKDEFFKAAGPKGRQPNFFILTSSLVISWIFAKSITNAADLGFAYGLIGGLAYATYYVSFLVAGVILVKMRTKGGFSSIHQFLQSRFGKGAIVVFTVLIAFRLMNEVWSNTMVIGAYFGEKGSEGYYLSILIFTLLTLAYVLKGGLRSSLFTDVIQMLLFAVLLVVVLGFILPSGDHSIGEYLSSSESGWSGGLNLMLLALVQVFSYPFHDPVMTDRAFISDPKTTLKSFVWATVIGFICIVLFSLVGVYARLEGIEGEGHAPVLVSRSLGMVMMLVMNLIMISSAASTLDSTFSSLSKLFVIDLGLGRGREVSRGRWFIILAAIGGTVPVFLGPEVLSATTISGSMVIGLAPGFLFWNRPAPALSWFLAVGVGVFTGVLLATGAWPENWVFFEGKYGDALSANLIGTAMAFLLYWLPTIDYQKHGRN